jgi:bacterioferritin
MAASKEEVIQLLTTAYCMELETVMNYLANSTNLDGVRAEEIKKSLAADITEELGHAQMLAKRIKQLGGVAPGSKSVKLGNQLQPPADTTDVVGVIQSVIAAEEAAVAHYRKIAQTTEGDADAGGRLFPSVLRTTPCASPCTPLRPPPPCSPPVRRRPSSFM